MLIIFIGVPFAAAQTNLEQEFKQLLQDRADGKQLALSSGTINNDVVMISNFK